MMIFKSGSPIAPPSTTLAPTPVLINGSHTFSIYLDTSFGANSTQWIVAYDNKPIVRLDLGGSWGWFAEAITERSSTSINKTSFPSEKFTKALQVYKAGAWADVPVGFSNGGTAWGIEGTIQDPSLPPDSIIVGGKITTTGSLMLWKE